MSDNPDRLPGLNLLSLDGGGITGLSSLLIMRDMMSRLQEKSQSPRMPDPWEHFDMIAGTGTGAISAVLLGRLRMSVADAISAYNHLMSAIFSEPKSALKGGNEAFKASVLEKELKKVVKIETGSEDEKMLEAVDAACKVVVYALSAYHLTGSLPREFRSYSARPTALTDCTIWEALRASTTHPELFKEIKVGNRGEQERFVHGSLGCSNPTARLLEEAREVFPGRQVASIVSVGTGHAKTIQVSNSGRCRMLGMGGTVTSVLKAALDMAVDNERVAEEMATRFADVEFGYYRLNVDQGIQGIEAKDWEKLSEVSAHTQSYLARSETKGRLEKAVDAIGQRKGIIEVARIDGRVVSSDTGVQRFSNCPPSSIRFTGRSDAIVKICEYFSSTARGQRVFVLYGLGGGGKTQLAIKCAWLLEQKFKILIFIDASSRESIEAALIGFASAKQLGLTHHDALRWITRHSEACLMIFDNADDQGVRLRDYFPLSPECNIIITTRHRKFIHEAEASYNVSGMEMNEAEEFLLRLVRLQPSGLERSEREALGRLLQELGCLALAVSQAGAFISSTQRTISQYYGMYSEQLERRDTFQTNATPFLRLDAYERTAYTTWELCFLRLSPRAKMLLWLIAFFHRDKIPQDIFRRAAFGASKFTPLVPPAPSEIAARQAVTEFLDEFWDRSGQWNDEKFQRCTEELTVLSLAEFDRVDQTYTIHPLAQEWAREIISDRAAAVENSLLLLALSSGFDDTTTGRTFRRAILPHVNTVLSHFTQIHNSYSNLSVTYAARFFYLYFGMGQTAKALALGVHLVKVSSQLLGNEHRDTLVLISNLASAYRQEGRLAEAERLYDSVVPAWKRLFGDHHPDTLMSQASLALTYHKQGRYSEAEVLEVKVLAARQVVLGDDHIDTWTSMSNLASTYCKQGRIAKAEELYVSVLAARKHMHGDEHPDTLTTMGHLASIYRKQRRLEEAEDLYCSVLISRRDALGDDHPDTITTMASLALTYKKQDRLGEAVELGTVVLADQRRVLGHEHPDTLTSMSNLASTYLKQGRPAEAEELYLSVLGARKRVLGAEHPDTLASIAHLATSCRKQGREEEAQALEESILAVHYRDDLETIS